MDSEFTLLYLVIRLSKVEQSAFFQFSPIGRVLQQLAAVIGFTLLSGRCRVEQAGRWIGQSSPLD